MISSPAVSSCPAVATAGSFGASILPDVATECVAELDAQDVTRSAVSASMLAAQKRIAREALLARLQAIGRTARVLAEDTPGLDQQFQVSGEAADHRLLTTGRRFVRDIEPFSSQCLAHGMAVTFVADLHALVDAFDRALRDCAHGRGARRVADANTRAALSRGNAAVRRLDAIVLNHLGDDAVTRTVWEHGRRIGYPARSRRTGVTRPRRQLALPLPVRPAHARPLERIEPSHDTREVGRRLRRRLSGAGLCARATGGPETAVPRLSGRTPGRVAV